MRAWKKTSPELVAAFHKALPTSPSVTRRPMFGYASAFVNGNMFAGTFQEAIVVATRGRRSCRAPQAEGRGAIRADEGSPMKEYVVVPASIVAPPKALGSWIERGHRYALGLPAKGTTKRPTAATADTTRRTGQQATAKKTAAKQTTATRKATPEKR